MEKQRKITIIKLLKKFIDNDKIKKMPMELREVEVESLEAYLYEHDIEIEVIKKNNLSNGNVQIILEKNT